MNNITISYGSDIHLEFGDYDVSNKHKSQVLQLAGDISLARALHDHKDTESPIEGSYKALARNTRNLFSKASAEYEHTFYVAGNHEFYNGKWIGSLNTLREECSKYPNVHFMENDNFVIGDTMFIGCTLWTNYNNDDPITHYHLSSRMNDYRKIRNDAHEYRALYTKDCFIRHNNSLSYISKTIESNPQIEKFVVITHHAPSFESIQPWYRKDIQMSGGYASDLSKFILANPKIALWQHGHTHDKKCYNIGDTIIACNPRGYIGHEPIANDYELELITI